MNKQLLMSYNQYRALGKHPVPYTYIIKKNGQYLYYFGARHSYNPLDSQFDEIDAFFQEFLIETNGGDRIVLIEGGNWPVMENKERAIIECSEAGYGAYLANQADILRASPEPKEKFRLAELEKQHFTREEIAFYEFALAVYQWSRLTEKKEIKTYTKPFLVMMRVKSGWDDFDFSFEHMKAIQKEKFNTEFDPTDVEFFRNIIDPTKDTSAINRVSRFEDSGFRDNYILGEIERYWKEGKSIFIIYGASHAVMQEPVIKSLDA